MIGWEGYALAFAIGWGCCCAYIWIAEWLDERRPRDTDTGTVTRMLAGDLRQAEIIEVWPRAD